jgi:hypothetical protein
MEHSKQIVTRIISPSELEEEMRRILDLLSAASYKEVKIMFGFAWGNWIYSDQWEYIPIPISEVMKRIQDEVDAGNGRIGDDDLYMLHPLYNCRLQFCHESDIHLWYTEGTPFVKDLFGQWAEMGLDPKLREKNGEQWAEVEGEDLK